MEKKRELWFLFVTHHINEIHLYVHLWRFGEELLRKMSILFGLVLAMFVVTKSHSTVAQIYLIIKCSCHRSFSSFMLDLIKMYSGTASNASVDIGKIVCLSDFFENPDQKVSWCTNYTCTGHDLSENIAPTSVAWLDAQSDWRPGGRRFNPRRGRQLSFVEIDHEIFPMVILSLPLIQEGQLSVSGERMCTILVNRLED